MKTRLAIGLKRTLSTLGSYCDAKTIYALNAALNNIAVGEWMKSHEMRPHRLFNSRNHLFEWAAESIKHRNVLYLEFGVFKGEITDLWSRLLLNENTHLHGFDSFEGLPETWTPLFKEGHFSTDGAIPKASDPRVTFFKGWFDQTLPKYSVPAHDELFINVDADLYSSTRTVLKHMQPHIQPGTYLYFDEFHHREHEMKAFDEFVKETGYKFELLAAVKTLDQVLFRRI